MKTIGCLIASLVLASASAGCAPSTSDAAHASSDALINGTNASPDMLRSSVLLFVSGVGPQCSAVAVGPRHLLLAAHCVVDTPNGLITSTISSGFQPGTDIWYTHAVSVPAGDVSVYAPAKIASTEIPVDVQLVCESGCDAGEMWSRSIADIAVVTLDRDLDPSVTPAVVDTEPLSAGETVTIQGYGCTDGSWAMPSGRELRYGETTILSLEDASGEEPFVPSDPDLFGETFAVTPGSSFGNASSSITPSVCPGDSGGGVYRGVVTPGAVEHVVAVNSGITTDSVRIPRLNYHTRVGGAAGRESATAQFLLGVLPESSFQ